MLPLAGSDFPHTREELARALREGLADLGGAAVRIESAGVLPALERLAIDLSGGRVPDQPPEPGASKHGAISVRELEIVARPLLYDKARIELEIRAREVGLEFQRDAQKRPLLALATAREGSVDCSIRRGDLEQIIISIARQAATEHGVSVERAVLKITASSPRAVDFSCEVMAQKLFMKTVIRLSGRVEVDDRLQARVSGLRCEGGGMVGGIACNFLKPYLARFEGRTFTLASFALGELRVVDLAMDAGEPLHLSARLG